ncbi:MAG: chemotaxis protein CheA, partial [Spirochaetes bacterium]
MNQLLEQFILEARDTLEKTSRDLLLLEKEPDNMDIIAELFRAVHTLKGNSGLFNFPAMTKVLHAAEDLMAAVRDNKLSFSAVVADNIFEAMDFVSTLLDEIEDTGELSTDYNEQSTVIAESVKSVNVPNPDLTEVTKPHKENEKEVSSKENSQEDLSDIPESVLMECFKLAQAGNVNLVTYSPEESSFYKGEDPFLFARRIPGFIWGTARGKEPWPSLEEMDCYRCTVEFRILSST